MITERGIVVVLPSLLLLSNVCKGGGGGNTVEGGREISIDAVPLLLLNCSLNI